MDCDAAGNLYVMDGPNGVASIYEIAPGSTTTTLLPLSAPPGAFAVDDQGDVYVAAYPLNAIEVFPPGATSPSRTIEGSLTQLEGPGSIAVPRTWTSTAERHGI
jgi:DNA-binding beta-propeller fold protein YncE